MPETPGARLRERPRREDFSPCRGVNVPIGSMMLLAWTNQRFPLQLRLTRPEAACAEFSSSPPPRW